MRIVSYISTPSTVYEKAKIMTEIMKIWTMGIWDIETVVPWD